MQIGVSGVHRYAFVTLTAHDQSRLRSYTFVPTHNLNIRSCDGLA
jgi:hypothetical protein